MTAEQSARWRRENPEAAKEAQRQHRPRQKAWIDGIKLAVGCMDCPEGTAWPAECLDFDHVRGDKVNHINRLINSRRETLLAEIAKCDVVCSNHHRIRTAEKARS